MGQTTDVLNIHVNVDGDQQFRERMRSVTGSTIAFKAAIAGATLATKKFIGSALELASNLEEVQNVVEVTFGGISDAINDFSKSALQNYGLSETIAKKYIGTFGAMSRSFGFIPEQAEKMSIALTAMAGDVASFYNLETDVAYTKLKSIFTGETESLKELGIVMTQTALDQYALEKGMDKTTKQMSEQEKVSLRYMFVMDKLKNVSGDYSNTSDGWANSIRTAKLQIQSMVAEVGSELMPAAKITLGYTMQGLRVVLGFLKSTAHGLSLFAEGWKASSVTTKVFVGVAAGAAVALFNFNKIAAVTQAVVGVASTAIKILNMNLTATLTLTQALKGALGIITVIGSIIGAVKLMSSISSAFDKVEESMKNQQSTVSDMNMEWEDGSDAVKDYVDSTKELERALMSFDEVNKIGDKSLLGDIVDKDSLQDLEQFKNSLDGLFDNVKFDGAFDGLFDGFEGLSSTFDGLIDKINRVKAIWGTPLEGETFGEKALDFLDRVDRSLEVIAPKWTAFWRDAGGTALDVFQEPKWRNKIVLIENLIKRHFQGPAWELGWKNTWGIVTAAWKVAFDVLSGDFASLAIDLNDLKVKAENLFLLLKSIITFDSNGIKQAVLGQMLGVKLNSPETKSSNPITNTDFSGNKVPTYQVAAGPTLSGKAGYLLPKYAAGGFPDMGEMFVARENGPEMVGKIGNKSAVANNEQITTALYNAVKSALGGNNNRGGTTVLYIDGKVLGKATVDYINNQTMSSGQSPLVEIG